VVQNLLSSVRQPPEAAIGSRCGSISTKRPTLLYVSFERPQEATDSELDENGSSRDIAAIVSWDHHLERAQALRDSGLDAQAE